MPLYEYQCTNCDHEFETIHKVSAPPPTACPECEQDGLKKKTSLTAFHLKGGGWYKDGYGASTPSKEGTNSTGKAGSPPKKDEKSPTKPEKTTKSTKKEQKAS